MDINEELEVYMSGYFEGVKEAVEELMDEDCSTCIYSRPVMTDGDNPEPLLKCFRFPAQIFVDLDGDVCQGYPDATNWCGEYKKVEVKVRSN